ncbi:fibronectin type III domain-containing protein [Nonomuraea sp. NPDC048901]|uniref:fibronectin type III domain-containing protein n=1 Tax=Nonomuraea sp. NPDC048901 TaxID=3155627 RepID=UPI0033CF85F4
MIVRWLLSFALALSGLAGPAAAAVQVATAEPLQPGPGQYYEARVRVLSNASIAGGATVTVKVAGVGGVPAGGVSSVAVNFAAKGASGTGGLIVYPSELTAAPGVTGTRYRSGVWEDQLLTVKLGTDGSIKVKNTGSAAVNVYAEVRGYFSAAAAGPAGAAYVPLDTARLVSNQSVAANSTSAFTVTGVGGVPATGVAFVALTVAVKSTGSGKMFAYPSGGTLPGGADIEYRPSYYQSNLVIVAPGADGKIAVNNSGPAALSVYADVAGYFVTPATAVSPSALVPVAPARIAGNVTVAAGATATVAPLGKGRVPASGVSAVGVNITAKGTANGMIRVYPGGQQSVPSGGSIAYQPNDFWSSLVPVKLGPGGTFVILNTGSANISVAVDTFDYYRAATVPAPPSGVTATAGQGRATVKWRGPSDGGAPITGYTVTSTPGGKTASVPAGTLEATLTGLTDGTGYTFTVSAVNTAGTGPESAPSDPVRPQPADVPMPPPGLLVTPLDQRVDVQWVPAVDGGSAITGYTVTVQPGGRSVDTAPDTTVTSVTGLADGTAYTVSVVARNAAGASAPSTAKPVTPSASLPPGPPDHLRAGLPASGSVQLTWDPPAVTGTSPVTSYTVTASPGGKTATVTGTTATLSGLDPATAYTFTVRAANASGTGVAGAPTQAITPKLTVKSAPVVLSPEAAATLRTVHEGQALEFDNPPAEVTGLTAGTLLVIGQSTLTPEGFFGKVVQTIRQNGLFIVQTVPATLAEAFTDANFAVDGQIDSGDQVTFVPSLPGARLVRPVKQGVSALGGGGVVLRDGALVIEVEHSFQEKGRMVTKVEGQVTLQQRTKMSAGTDSSARGVDITNSTSVSSELRVKQNLSQEFEKRVHIGHVNGPCFTFNLGRVPVVVCLRFSVALGIEGGASVGATFSVHWDKTLGTRCHVVKGGTTCTPVDDGPGFYLDGGVGLFGDSSLTATVSTDIQLLVYGVVGPALVVDLPGVQLKADTTQNPWWELRGLARLGAAIDLGAISKDYSLWRKDNIVSASYTIAHAASPFQGIKVTPPLGTVGPGQNHQFKVAVSGYPDDVETQWSMVSGPGTVTLGGLYMSPQEGIAEVAVVSPATGGHPQLEGRGGVIVGTQYGTPGPPQLDAYTKPTLRGASVSWTPPADHGASPISGYVVTATADDGSGIKSVYAYDGDATHQLIQGLKPGVSYTVSVIAQNNNGTGEPSGTTVLKPLDIVFPGPPSTLGADLASSTEYPGRPDSTGTAGGMGGGSISGDGKYIVFETQGRGNLMPQDSPYRHPASRYPYVVRKQVDGTGGGSVVASIEPDGNPSYNMYTEPLISRDGNVVAYTGSSYARPGVFRGVVHDITAGTSWTTEDNAQIYGVSDNGQVVLYWKSASGQAANLYRQVKGAAAQKLTNCTGLSGPECALTPPGRGMLSGDGNRVVWSTADSAGKRHSWLYNAPSGTTTEIFPGADVAAPLISGDGQVVVLSYTSPDRLTSCFVIKALSNPPPTAADCRVSDTSAGRAEPIFLSKDGRALAYRWIAFAGGSPNRTSLRVYYDTTTTHIAGGSPDTWPSTAFITDDNQRLVYSLWRDEDSGGTSSTVPGLWYDFTTDSMSLPLNLGPSTEEKRARAGRVPPRELKPFVPHPLKAYQAAVPDDDDEAGREKSTL